MQTYADRYILEGMPRRGGSALVYKARDPQNDFAPVALKVFDAGARVAAPLEAKFFSAEVGVLSRLEHPNIVRLVDWGTKPDYYIALEWLEGDLWDALAGGPYADWDRFWRAVGEPVLDALAWAYRTERVIHRDVSPGNILLGPDGIPKLTDFGLSKVVALQSPVRSLTVANLMSKPFALSSDDPSGPHIATRDVFGFAAVAVFALTATHPFKDDEHLRTAFAGLSIEPAISAILSRCLAEDERARPESTEALLTELRNAQQRREGAGEQVLTLFVDISRVSERSVGLLRVENDADVQRMIAADLGGGIALASYVARGRHEPGNLRGYGTEFSYHLKTDQAGGGYVVVVNVSRPPAEVVERLRSEAFAPQVDIRLGRPQAAREAQRALDELLRDVADHEASGALADVSEDLHDVLARWRAVLELRENAQRQLRQGVRYSGRRVEGGRVLFTFANPTTLPPAGEAVLVCDASGQRILGGEVIEARDSSLLIARTHGADPAAVPTKGSVRIDTTPADTSLRRQRDALKATEDATSLRRDLGPLLSHPGDSRAPEGSAGDGGADDLDPAQRDALAKASAAQDFVVVEGPPGTGKTRFIAALVGSVLAENPDARLLVVSQTNVAVDNALERIAEAHGAKVRIVRVGAYDSGKISARAQEWLLPEQLKGWRQEVVDRSRAFVDAEARRQGLDVSRIELAVDLEELADAQDRAASVRASLRGLQGRAPRDELVDGNDSGTAGDDVDSEATARQLTSEAGDRAALDDQMEGLREELDRLSADRRGLLDLIAARPGRPAQRVLEQGTPDALRRLAAEAIAAAGAGAAALRRKVQLHAEWIQRFGHGAAFEAAVLRRAQIVGATCVGLASSPGYPTLEFDVCILDEASRAAPTEALVPLVRARRWVMVGDLRQLPPFIEESMRDRAALGDMNLRDEDLAETAFSRLMELLPGSCTASLTTQYRMVPAIGTLINRCFYEGRLVNGRDPEPLLVGALLGRPVVWLTTRNRDDRREAARGNSWVNDAEASVITRLLSGMNFLLRAERESPLRVGILSGYLAQCSHIAAAIASQRDAWSALEIEVGTVDAVQGREFDVVLYSVTRSNSRGVVGFLRDARRMNVALSRAMRQLVIVGDDGFCRDSRDHPLKYVLEHIERHPDDCCIAEA